MTIVVLMQNISSFGPFREKIGSNSQNSGRQLQQNEGRSRNSDKSLFIIGPKEAVSSSGLKKGAPQFQLGTIVHGLDHEEERRHGRERAGELCHGHDLRQDGELCYIL